MAPATIEAVCQSMNEPVSAEVLDQLGAYALRYVKPGQTVGLGTGHAASAFIRALGERGIKVRGVPTSTASAELARSLGIEVVALDGKARLDVDIDGADEVDPRLNLVKGYGGAMVREKVVACASRKVVILVGAEKRVKRLGERRRLPVEVVPFAAHYAMRRMRELGLKPAVRIGDGRARVPERQRQFRDGLRDRQDRSSGPPRARVARDSGRGRHRTFRRYRERRADCQWRRFDHHAGAPALVGAV